MGKNKRLTQFVHRTLVLHLMMAGVLFAVIAAALTYYQREGEISDGVLARATRSIDRFQEHTLQLARDRGLSSPEAMQEALAVLGQNFPADPGGRFVLARVIDLQGKLLFEHRDRSFSNMGAADRMLDSAEPRRSREGFRYEMVPIEGGVIVYLQVPIRDAMGFTMANARGLYLLSKKTRAALQRDIFSSVLFSFGMVVLITLLLYPVILMLIRRLGRLTETLLHSNLETLQVVGSAIAKRDSDTDAHNYRVSLYSAHLAMALGLPRSDMRRLLKGAFLHDVGKIGIRDSILHKLGALDAAEMEVMRQHVSLGLDIIGRSHWLADAAEVVGGHHERFDGSGYPQGLRGEDIPLLARIFAIADVFDALCSVRPYKKAFPLETALNIMRQASGQHFDQRLFGVFEPLASGLYARYAGRDDERMREELDDILHTAFTDKLSRMAV